MLNKILLPGFILILYSCATGPDTVYQYNEIVIRNNSDSSLQDVKIRVDNTNTVFSCSNIPAAASCSNRFRQREYLGNPVQISWTHQKKERTSGKFRLKVPNYLDPDIPLRGVLEVNKQGIIKTYFEQAVQ